MDDKNGYELVCPIRGRIRKSGRSKQDLKPSEEYYRIQAIRCLLGKGYPKENFLIEPVVKRFGNGGRNSFRSDFAVLDIPAAEAEGKGEDFVLDHAVLICEVKRENAKSGYAKGTQVEPMLDFAKLDRTVALYWDSVERRVFWTEHHDGKREHREGPLSFLPKFGSPVSRKPLTFNKMEPSSDLKAVFSKIDAILHKAALPPEKRGEIILKLLLAKIRDEHASMEKPDEAAGIQDFAALGVSDGAAFEKFFDIMKNAVKFYQRHLPNKLDESFGITPSTLSEILQVLAPVKIIGSKRDVIQTFYMKFAKDLYKWDLAQYFTPPAVTDFIVSLANPQFGELAADPACGSADFLVAAFRIGKERDPEYADCVSGVDNAPNAVQVAVLNMVLNGDGKSHIRRDDSLEHIEKYADAYDIVLCNPPFGTKIKEKREDVLKKFELGSDLCAPAAPDGTRPLLEGQEAGILFVEACVKECRPGGRIAIILPNGYLGNLSPKYVAMREWLLRHVRVCAVIGLPRFTFKASGADVSATVVYMEKMEAPVPSLSAIGDYPVAVEMVERIGWQAGDKKGSPVYRRNPDTGEILTDEQNAPVLDCDFADIESRIVGSDAAEAFPWIGKGKKGCEGGWTVRFRDIAGDETLTLDAKRLCRKARSLRSGLLAREHVLLGDIADFLPEMTTSAGERVEKNESGAYRYVEISDIGDGTYAWTEMRGWQLPGRAKHFAESGDVYFGSIWGSAVKWCVIPETSMNEVVTNGCFRCRIKGGREDLLIDWLAYMETEGWGVQVRSVARGSDGLASITQRDAENIVIPLLTDKAREDLRPVVEDLLRGRRSLKSVVGSMHRSKEIPYGEPEKRPSHIVLV